MNEPKKPKRGAIALDEHGRIGIITSIGRVHVIFDSGAHGVAYLGTLLHGGNIWASVNPTVIAETFEAFLEEQHQRVALEAAREGLREHFATQSFPVPPEVEPK